MKTAAKKRPRAARSWDESEVLSERHKSGYQSPIKPPLTQSSMVLDGRVSSPSDFWEVAEVVVHGFLTGCFLIALVLFFYLGILAWL